MPGGRVIEALEVRFTDDIEVQLVDHMGSDERVTQAARVSTKGADAYEPGAKEGLIRYLSENQHGTPFEHAAMTFLVTAPIFVFREWHRHRIGWSYNEESGRYKQLEPRFYIPNTSRDIAQVPGGKPGHYLYKPGTADQYMHVGGSLKAIAIRAYAEYEEMLADGIAKEVARMCLPVNIYSSMFATCNPRSLMAFLTLRTKHPEANHPSNPQREIAMAAEKMEAVFADLFPLTYNAYVKAGREAP